VVIEVSYSQKRRDLSRLADDYILGSDAEICTVVGIDLDYGGGKKATVSIWRPRIEINDAGEKELVAHQTLSDLVYSLIIDLYHGLTPPRNSAVQMTSWLMTRDSVCSSVSRTFH